MRVAQLQSGVVFGRYAQSICSVDMLRLCVHLQCSGCVFIRNVQAMCSSGLRNGISALRIQMSENLVENLVGIHL